MQLIFESDLDGSANRRVLVLNPSDESQSFLHAAIELHKRYSDPLETDALVNATTHVPYHYEFEYVGPPSGEWIPPSIRIDFDVTVGTVARFFGGEITDSVPHLRLVARGPRGDIGFYPAEVAYEVISKAFEIYGFVVAGAALVRFAARRRTGVPFEAVERWKNTGAPDDELVRFVQRQSEWTAVELSRLLDADVSECRKLLEECDFHLLTSAGTWWRTRDDGPSSGMSM